MAALSSTLIDVVIPEIMGELGMPLERAHWLATGFLIANTICLLLTASSIDRYGLRRTFLLGIAVFGIGAGLGCVVSDDILLIGSRIIQGAGAGLLQPVAVVAIARVFPPERRGLAMGIFGAGVLMGPTLGPLFGAVLVDTLGWRSTYAAQLPLAAASFLLGSKLLEPDAPSNRSAVFDAIGFCLLCVWVSCLLLMLSALPVYGSSDPVVPLLCTIGAAAFFLFLVRQMSAAHCLVMVRLFAIPIFAIGNVIAFVIGFALYGSLLLIPLYLQSVLHLSATTSGLVLLPAGLIMVALSPLGGYLSDVWSPRFVVSLGMSLFAASIGMMTSIGPQTSFMELVLAVCLGRAALSCVLPSMYSSALRAVPAQTISQAAGITNFSRQLGGTLGVAAAAVFLSSRATANWQVFVGDLDPATLQRSLVAFPHSAEFLALEQGRLWAVTYAYREVLWATSAGVLVAALAGMFMGRAVKHS